MSRYVSIVTRIWHDEKFRELTEDVKLLFLYLLSSPHNNMCGLYFLPSLYACHDLQWKEEKYRKALKKLIDKKMICTDGDIVLIKNYLKYNPIKGPKQAVGAANRLKEVPDTKLIGYFMQCLKENISEIDYQKFIDTYDIPYQYPIETPPIPESDPESESESDPESESESEAEKPPPAPYQKIKDLYNTICVSCNEVEIMTKSRKSHVQARWKQYKYDLSVFEKLFRKVEESSFLRGNNKRNWRPDFDWLMNETNMAKVLEGRYDDNKEWNPAWKEADGGKQEKIKKVDTDKIVEDKEWNPAWEKADGGKQEKVKVDTDKIVEDVFKSLEVDDGQAVKK